MLRGTRQIPSKKGSDLDSRNTTQQKKSEKGKERGGGERKRPVELKGKFSEIQVNDLLTQDSMENQDCMSLSFLQTI